MKIINELNVEDPEGVNKTLTIENFSGNNDYVIIKFEGVELYVIAQELLSAIKNSTNDGKNVIW